MEEMKRKKEEKKREEIKRKKEEKKRIKGKVPRWIWRWKEEEREKKRGTSGGREEEAGIFCPCVSLDS